jgi:hypothetical protein
MPLGPNAGYKLFNTGDVLTAAQVQNNLQNQSVMFFASAAARDADTALTAALTEGMFCYLADVNQVQFYTGSAWVGLLGGGGALPTLTSPKETITTVVTAPPAAVEVDVLTSSILIYTGTATADWTLNVRGNSTTTLNSIMSVGEQISVVFEAPIGATAYEQTTFTIDGSAPASIKYLGGTTPVGNINSTDVYVYTIRKTAAATFTVIASQNKFA